MKTYLGIFIIVFLLSCNKEKEPLQNSKEFYAEILKKKLAENGIENSEYFTVYADEIDIDNLSHGEIISNIDKAIPLIKKEYEKAIIKNENVKKSAKENKTLIDNFTKKKLNLLIKTVKEHHLENKEPFYQKLLALESIEEQVALYEAEQKEFRAKMDAASHDLRLAADTQEHYAYLEVYARDQNGELIPMDLINDENKNSTSYTIKKYDPKHIQLLKNVVWE